MHDSFRFAGKPLYPQFASFSADIASVSVPGIEAMMLAALGLPVFARIGIRRTDKQFEEFAPTSVNRVMHEVTPFGARALSQGDSRMKHLISKNRWILGVGALAALMILVGNPGTASAQQISGDIGFGGVFKPANLSFGSSPLEIATSIDYNGNGIQDSGFGFVVLSTGDFASFAPAGTFASLSDFLFNPLPAGGVNPLWSAGGFSFALDSISIDTQNASTLSLVGTGTVSGNSFGASAGTWNFTGNPIGASSFIFSAGTGTVAALPEPEIYAMMGVGLGLIGWMGRRKKLGKGAAA